MSVTRGTGARILGGVVFLSTVLALASCTASSLEASTTSGDTKAAGTAAAPATGAETTVAGTVDATVTVVVGDAVLAMVAVLKTIGRSGSR